MEDTKNTSGASSPQQQPDSNKPVIQPDGSVVISRRRWRIFKILEVVFWLILLVVGISVSYVLFHVRDYVTCPTCDLMTCLRYCNKNYTVADFNLTDISNLTSIVKH